MTFRVSVQGLLDRAVEISTERDVSLHAAMSLAQNELDAKTQQIHTRIKMAASKRLDECLSQHSIEDARSILTNVGRKLRKDAA